MQEPGIAAGHRAGSSVHVQKDNQRMSGGNLQAAHAYFGQSPPPNYLVALLSEVRGGLALQALVYRDKRGQYLTLDGAAKVRARFAL